MFDGQKRKTSKQKKYLKLLFFALLITFIQFFIFKSCVNSNSSENNQNKYAVIFAKDEMKPGSLLEESNTKIVYIDVSNAKNSFILNSELSKFLGSRLLISADKNTPILKNMIKNDMLEKTAQEKIPPGKRLFILDIELGSLASIIQINDKIDIIAHMDIPEFGKVTETILDGIPVVRIAEDHAIGFYLTPDEIKILSFMKPYSSFSVAIRNPNDHLTEESKAVTFNKFLQNDKIQHILQNESFKIVEGIKK